MLDLIGLEEVSTGEFAKADSTEEVCSGDRPSDKGGRHRYDDARSVCGTCGVEPDSNHHTRYGWEWWSIPSGCNTVPSNTDTHRRERNTKVFRRSTSALIAVAVSVLTVAAGGGWSGERVREKELMSLGYPDVPER